jgi:hypothetical protein
VISLWGDAGRDKASLVTDVYEAIRSGHRDPTGYFSGQLNFQHFLWIDVPGSFTLEGFCRRLPCYVSDGYHDPDSYFAGRWIKEVTESRWLIVIEGLQSPEDWDLIKDAGLVPEHTKSCVIVIANEEAVAKHCEDKSWRKSDRAAIVCPLRTQEKVLCNIALLLVWQSRIVVLRL